MSYTHFTLDERKYLQQLLSEGYSFRKIAEFLGRNVSSVSREVNRNKSKYPPKKKSNNKFRYHCWRAQTLYIRRRRENQKQVLVKDSFEWKYIIEKLEKYWSPEQIVNRYQIECGKKMVSVSTIYRYIKKGELPNITNHTHLRRRGKKFVSRNSCYNTIHPDRIITQWGDEIKGRTRIGDWEGDTVYGAIGKGLVVTLVDRKTRYLLAGKLQSRNAHLTEKVLINLLKDKPVKSLSLDNGSEFANFKEDLYICTHSVKFSYMHKSIFKYSFSNYSSTITYSKHSHKLSLHICRESWMW